MKLLLLPITWPSDISTYQMKFHMQLHVCIETQPIVHTPKYADNITTSYYDSVYHRCRSFLWVGNFVLTSSVTKL